MGTTGSLRLVQPRWPAAETVRAFTTERTGGVSSGAFESLNLSDGVGDRAAHVAENRLLLARYARLPAEPQWLAQRHGARIVHDDAPPFDRDADGAVTRRSGRVCAITTADCLPILLCDRAATTVGAVHAGWRGLAAGVIEAGLEAMRTDAAELLAWLGPGIGPDVYEVGEEVRMRMLRAYPDVEHAFRPSRAGHWRADLAGIAEHVLRRRGVSSITNCGRCTYSEPDAFFSHRRDGVTGRFTTLIWLEAR
jgi:YfiH family protein